MSELKHIDFPLGKVYMQKTDLGIAYLEYNKSFVNKFNSNLDKTQVFLDQTVIKNLMQYVSFRTGLQETSILLSSIPGSGKVHINVPYAQYQAYSKRIRKRVGKRGTQPFERMCADKAENILKQVSAYARRINN